MYWSAFWQKSDLKSFTPFMYMHLFMCPGFPEQCFSKISRGGNGVVSKTLPVAERVLSAKSSLLMGITDCPISDPAAHVSLRLTPKLVLTQILVISARLHN